MRIGMILDNVYPPDPRVENEAIELIKSGHTVFLFCLTYGNEEKEENIQGIEVRRYKTNELEYKLSALAYTIPLYSILMKSKIKDFITKNKIEAIHIHDIRIAEAAFLANKKANLPTTLDLHENRPEIMRFYPHLQKPLGKLLISISKWKKKEEEFVKKSSKVVVVTEDAKQELVDRVGVNKDKIIVVPNTIRTSFFEGNEALPISFNKQPEDFIVLYLGDTGTRRGLKTVVDGIINIEKEEKIKNIKFVIVGKESRYLEKMIHEYNLQKQVVLMGWQNDKTFRSWIEISDVCVSPLHRNIHHDTTYANKIFQYMSMGKPVLVSDATAQKKVVEQHGSGLVHVAEDVKDFTDKLLTLYHDKTLRDSLGTKGASFIKNHFTWDKTSEQLINLYKNL